jgi:hypothetical protein
MSPTEIINQLKKTIGAFEGYHTTSFKFHRNMKSGDTQDVTVEILDAGSDVDSQLRYHCIARTEDGKVATGNPASSIDEVISLVQWHKLDA